MSALSIAATWIWAPALFVSTEKAYSTGWVGLFWFLVPNALCLVIFIPFAKKIRKEMPEGMTLSGYMKEKYKSDGVKRVYLFQLIGLSVLSTGVQLLAGSQILSAVTGISFKTMTILLACIAISYSLFSGIKASMLTDAIQMVFMLVACSLFVIFGVRNTGTQGIIQGPEWYIRRLYNALFWKRSRDFLSLWASDNDRTFIRAVWRSELLAEGICSKKREVGKSVSSWSSSFCGSSAVNGNSWIYGSWCRISGTEPWNHSILN